MSNIQKYLNNILKAVYGKDVRQSIHDAIREVDAVADTAQNSASASALASKASETAAKTSETASKASETASKASETAAKASETAAKASETAAKASETASKASETAAKASETAAKASEAASKSSETNASRSASDAAVSAGTAVNKANEACGSAANAAESEDYAKIHADKSQSYAVGGTGTRTGENNDNAKYYYEQSRAISESFSGALRPMGTVAFSALPALSSASAGDMYNVSEQFTTTADFKEGVGHVIPAGANVYKTADGKWDVLAGTPVSSVNGETGNVSVTPENIGAVSVTGGTMTGMLDTVYDSGQVKVFCDNRGGHVWIYNTALKKVLQIVCENDVAEFHLVDTSGTPTLLNFFQLDSGTFSTGKNLAIGAGANEDNRRIDFISPKRHIWAGHANSNGNFYLYDTTNNKSILSSTAAGVSTFHGNAASATNADTVDGKHASDLQNYNNLTNKPAIPNSVAVKGNKEGAYRQGNVNLTPANIGAVNAGGDTMTGTLTLNNSTANTPSIQWLSTLRKVWAGCVNGAGTWYLWDSTNNKAILESNANGNTFMQGTKVTVQNMLEAGGLRSNVGWIDIYYNGQNRVSMWSHEGNPGKFDMQMSNVETNIYSHWARNGGDWYVGVRYVNYDFNAAAVIPYGDGTQHLGGNGARWAQLWASNATITTSDRNYKEEIEYLSDDDAKDIIMHLKPASFRFKNKEGDIITHDRRHFGFIAQDIEDDIVDGLGISSGDLGFFIKSPTKDIPDYDGDLDYIYSLRYEEFIALAVKTIQTQQKEIESQRKEIEAQQEKVDNILRRLEALESGRN